METQAYRFTLIMFALTTALLGCGGGTEGSGLRTYDGTVVTKSAEPLKGARLTIVDTGETTLTDGAGEFTLRSAAEGDVEFVVQIGEADAQFVVQDVEGESRRVSMHVEFDTVNEIATLTNVTLKAAIIDSCDYFFENGDTIRQANHVPQGMECVLLVHLVGDGLPLDSVPVELQVRRCGDHVWDTIDMHTTGDEGTHGETKFLFQYEESDSVCEYRVKAPHIVPGTRDLTYEIESFAEQELELASSGR